MSEDIGKRFSEVSERLIEQVVHARATLTSGDIIRTRAELARTMVNLVKLYDIINGE